MNSKQKSLTFKNRRPFIHKNQRFLQETVLLSNAYKSVHLNKRIRIRSTTKKNLFPSNLL